MSAVAIKLTAICSGGNHLTFSATGDASVSRTLDLDVLTEAIDPQEVEAFVKLICKLAKKGRTLNQAKTLLQNGVVVTV